MNGRNQKPKFESVAYDVGRTWRGGGDFIYEEKIDGVFHVARIGAHLVAGELLRADPPASQRAEGVLYAFDVLEADGEDIRGRPLRERLRVLEAICRRGDVRQMGPDAINATDAPGFNFQKITRPAIGNGGEFLEAIIASGGEGIVAKELSAPYGARWFKCKRSQVFYCRVMARDLAAGAVDLADSVSGERRGRLALRGGKFERVRVGSVLKVEAYGLTARGMLREPRPDRDGPESWLARF